MTKTEGSSSSSDEARGMAVHPGFFLRDETVAAAVARDLVVADVPQIMNGERQAGIGHAAEVDQPAVRDSARRGALQGAQDPVSDRLAIAAVACMVLAAVTAFAMVVMR